MKDHSVVRKTACHNCSIPHSISGCCCFLLFLFCFSCCCFLSHKAKTHSLPALSHKLAKTVAILECGCGLRYLAIEYLWQEATDYQLPTALQNKMHFLLSLFLFCFYYDYFLFSGADRFGVMFVLPCKTLYFLGRKIQTKERETETDMRLSLIHISEPTRRA